MGAYSRWPIRGRSGTGPRQKNMSTPTLSVVVPAFNAAGHLGACLASVFAGGRDDIEVIVVDDGSTDASMAVLEPLCRADPRVRVVQHPGRANRGVSASRNLGLHAATGRWVWFVDADDLLEPGAIARVVEAALQTDADVVTFNAVESGAGLPDRLLYNMPKPATVMSGEQWVGHWSRHDECRQFIWLRVCRRAYLSERKLQFAEGLLHEDIPWATEVDLGAARVIYLDRILYRWMRNPESQSRVGDDASLMKRALSLVEIVFLLREVYARHPVAAATRHALQSELVGQGMQIAQLRKSIADPGLRGELDRRLADTAFWKKMWPDAVTFRRKRHVALQWLGGWLRL
jgi:heptose III glucuronosyltransferase